MDGFMGLFLGCLQRAKKMPTDSFTFFSLTNLKYGPRDSLRGSWKKTDLNISLAFVAAFLSLICQF
jgi:hypothetical protein